MSSGPRALCLASLEVRRTCTAPEFGGQPVTCGLGRRCKRQDRGSWFSSALPDCHPGVRLARAAGPQPGVQERGDHGPPARLAGATTSGHPGRRQTGPTGRSWPRWPGSCQQRYGLGGSSRRERCWPGTAGWLHVHGPIRIIGYSAGHCERTAKEVTSPADWRIAAHDQVGYRRHFEGQNAAGGNLPEPVSASVS
jgi:hypothetical protein